MDADYEWIIPSSNSRPVWGFSYVKAVRDEGGRLVCVLDTDFDIPALNVFMKSLGTENHCQLQVVELGPTPHLIGDPGLAGSRPLPLPESLAPLLKLSGDVFVGRMKLDGENRWVAARRLDLRGGVSWLVVASRKDNFIEAPLRRQLYQVGAMGLGIVLGLVLVSVQMARRFGQPLAALEQRVASIGQPGPRRAAEARRPLPPRTNFARPSFWATPSIARRRRFANKTSPANSRSPRSRSKAPFLISPTRPSSVSIRKGSSSSGTPRPSAFSARSATARSAEASRNWCSPPRVPPTG